MKHGSWGLQLLLLVIWEHFTAAAPRPVPPLPTGFEFADECDRDFSLRAELGVDGTWPEGGAAWIVFHWQAEGSGYAAVLEADQARFFKVEGGSLQPLGDPTHLYYETPYQPLVGPVTLQRHADRMALIVGGYVVARAADADFRAGRIGLWAAPGLTWQDLIYQPTEDLYFLDDFIRWGEEGEWQVVRGSGEVSRPPRDRTSPTTDVFTYHLRPAVDKPALALAGYWFHCDYLVEAAVKPLGEGTVGLCLYAQDADNYLLFEWTSGPQGYARVRCVRHGREEYPDSWNQMAASPEGGYEPGQWYRLAFQADADCLRAFINGRLVLKVHSVSFGQGCWGLHAAGCEAVFDDVRAESGGEPTGRKLEEQTVRDVWRYGPPATLRRPWMLEWGWQGQPSHATWYQGALYRDPLLWLSFRSVPPLLRATIGADTEEFGRGYDLEVRPGPRPRLRLRRAVGCPPLAPPSQGGEPEPACQVRWRLLRQGREVADGYGDWTGGSDFTGPYSLRFGQVGSQVRVSFGGWKVFTWNDPRPLHGRRAGYWLSEVGSGRWAVPYVDPQWSQAWSPHLLEYWWTQAPVDWRVRSGTWAIESRSGPGCGTLVYRGSAPPEAAIWHKLHFAGDLVVEVFAAGQHDLNVTLCGDGADVRSGYSFIFAGWNRTRSAILKQGQVVADAPFKDSAVWPARWHYLRLEKQGRRLRFAANHQSVCEYTDPQPLGGGQVALWTQQGDLVLYRVRVWYEDVEENP